MSVGCGRNVGAVSFFPSTEASYMLARPLLDVIMVEHNVGVLYYNSLGACTT